MKRFLKMTWELHQQLFIIANKSISLNWATENSFALLLKVYCKVFS